MPLKSEDTASQRTPEFSASVRLRGCIWKSPASSHRKECTRGHWSHVDWLSRRVKEALELRKKRCWDPGAVVALEVLCICPPPEYVFPWIGAAAVCGTTSDWNWAPAPLKQCQLIVPQLCLPACPLHLALEIQKHRRNVPELGAFSFNRIEETEK